MALLPEDAVEELLRLYGEDELALVRTLIGSSTLRAAARLIVDAQAGTASIFIPHYWAVYYHDGRAGFTAPGGRVLVFFADPDDDPRLEGGYPVRASEIRRLTRDEFYADPDDDPRLEGGYPVRASEIRRLTRDEFDDGLAENERRAADGAEPFMFVVRSVGPAVPGEAFFAQLAIGAAARMDQFASFMLDSFVQDSLDEEGPQKSTARVRL